MSAVQQGHFVAFIGIVEVHLGHGFVDAASSFFSSFFAADWSLFIPLIKRKTAKATIKKLIIWFIKSP